MVYHQVKLKVTPAQQKKALKGQKIRMTKDNIGQGQLVMLHPLNYKKVMNAKGGINLELSPGELIATASHHNLAGSGFFGDVWEGLKSAGRWLKDSGVGSVLADVAQEVATPFVGHEIARTARGALKSFTGVGIKGGKGCKGRGLYL
jgi:hypothetical protein